MNTHISVVRFLSVVLVLCCIALGAVAQEKMKHDMKQMGDPKGVQGAFVKQSMFVENQFVTLAEAIPQDKYNWRPAEGVRSIAESFLHVARGNYGILTFIGAKVPEGVDMEKLEKSSTDKATIVDAMKKSFKAVNDYVQSVPESDFGREIDFFGNKMTVLDMIMLAATHQHETLGQSIAYARSNGVKPPWSGM
ncbi:MAG TPA: DinB family protein [Bacteroidota bacterium]